MKRFLSALICLGLLFSFCSPIAEAAPRSGAVTTVIACSDFQPDWEDYAAGTKTVQDILAAMGKDGITSADGLLFCGDYHAQLPAGSYVDLAKQGLEALKAAVGGFVTGDLVLGKGNHDAPDPSVGMSPSGPNDPSSGAYGVFLINEDDYMWFNGDEARVKRTAQNLKAYLNEKRADGFNKPIFVLSHLALNYSMRTYRDGDGKYAHYIFDVLNEAGEAGLNIFFMFGHNHSNGWDDYLGGAAVYLAKGDKIFISQGDQHAYKEETLNFTYLNAGYVGYYRNENGADDTLTMTVFQISENEVTVARYDASGKHVLKASGVKNTHAANKLGVVETYLPNAAEYASPQVVKLTKTIDPPPPEPEKESACYARITDFNELTDGGKYLLMLCSSSVLGSEHEEGLMLPSVVTKEDSSGVGRTGFDVEFLDDLGGETMYVYGDPDEREWTFTKAGTSWQIGKGTQRAGLSDAGSELRAYLLSAGNVGVLSMVASSDGKCIFTNGYQGGVYLNYNKRGLVNGYASDPAEFYIYKFEGYDVRVEGGSSDVAVALPGVQVNITADAAPEGQVFVGWEVVSGGVTLSAAEKVNPSITVTMPAGTLKLRATYRSEGSSARPEPCDSHSFGSWTSVAEADCTSAGIRRRVCVVCGRAERKWLKPLGHEYSSSWTIDVPATETAAGERSHHCVRCGERADITVIPMIPLVLTYSDVKAGDWYYTAVQYAVSHSLFNGVGASRFAPDEAMNRAMLATVLWRMGGKPASGEYNPYTDIDSGKYYTSAVLWTWADSIFAETDGAEFMPAEDATREQMAVALYRYSQWKGYDTSKRADLLSFPDGGSTSDFAKEALSWAVAEGLIAGENRGGVLLLNPQGSATRAQVATILMRYQMDIVERQEIASPAN